jgi:hypothetical protein
LLDFVFPELLKFGIVQQERIELVLVDPRRMLQIFGIEDVVQVFHGAGIKIDLISTDSDPQILRSSQPCLSPELTS